MTVAVVVAVVAIGLGLVAYWAFVITEGAYIGPRTVVALYDRSATEYDDIKGFDVDGDHRYLAAPLIRAGIGLPGRRLLDVATGTGRLPIALLSDPTFEGEIVGLDLSQAMLAAAWRKVGGWSPRIHLVRAPAHALPFAPETFDCVTMVEALEFTPSPGRVLAELLRVLVPGGELVITNRVGWEAKLMPGRAYRAQDLERLLEASGVDGVETSRWQTYYDLVSGRKAGPRPRRPPAPWPSGLLCVACGRGLAVRGATLGCQWCGACYVWRGGAWDLARDRSNVDDDRPPAIRHIG